MKKYLFGTGALMLAIVFSSFSLAPKTAVWYDFTGSTSLDYNDATKYVLDSDNAAECAPNQTGFRCEILAQPDASNPSIPDLSQSFTIRNRP